MKINKIVIYLASILLSANFVKADFAGENKFFNLTIDRTTIEKGYTVSAFDEKIKLSLVPGILNEATPVDLLQLNEEMEMPRALDKVSEIYQFEFKNKSAYDNRKPFYIQLSYEEQTNCDKELFFYDKGQSEWRPLPTKDFPEENFVRSLIHLPFARIAVFSNSEKMTVGRASWYSHKPGLFAASPNFPKGSRLRVTNMENDKFIDVTINDFGPDRVLHPDRVVDLEKMAFAKIAPIGAGMIDVKIEPLQVVKSGSMQVLGVSESSVDESPKISVKAAIVVDENNGSVIYEKKATSVLPLASLTKLVAVKVFLDTRPSLNTSFSYSLKDEEYNYAYAEKWEIARLKLKEGDEVTIEDLIYASLVGSANNAIETLVRVSGISREEFILKMNENVKNWGAVSTKFYEPTGLDPQNVSTVKDYAIITNEVMKNLIISKASVRQEYDFVTINTKEPHHLKNTNNIIRTNQFNITGSKTGYLEEAGYCLMTKVEEEGKNIIVVTFGAETKNQSILDTTTLIKYGLRTAIN